MDNKIIDFKKSKENLINKKFPNISFLEKESKFFVTNESNKLLEQFLEILYNYQNYLIDSDNNKEVKLEEVFLHFNRYFDSIYSDLLRFDSAKTPKLKEAIDYAMLSSGKRIRPFLMLITYNFCYGEDFLILAPFMVAIEMIHTFSLVHDDLPCMDNDELRRGKPSVWKKYGEDMAVLVGDALMIEASAILVEIITELLYTDLGSYVSSSALVLLKLAGLSGMIVGQTFDVINTGNKNLNLDDINYMYSKKTTALLTASMVIGANLSGKFGDKMESIENLSMYLGQSYQIKDDLLEVEGTTEQIGKSVNSDKDNDKVTFVDLVGVDTAKKELEHLYEQSIKTIDMMTTSRNRKEALVFKETINYLLRRNK